MFDSSIKCEEIRNALKRIHKLIQDILKEESIEWAIRTVKANHLFALMLQIAQRLQL